MKIVNWKLLECNPQRQNEIAKKYNVKGLTAKVLASRGYDDCELESIINPKPLLDPYAFLGMQKAVDEILKAIDSGDKIAIYGDYDCDGVCASTILYGYLNSAGADVFAYIPKREDGYGVNKEGIDEIKAKGAKLIITVDNGITAVKEADYAYAKGLKLIITDHHKPSLTLPKALAIINPNIEGSKYGFREICGCVVALKLVAAMEGGNNDMAFDFGGDLAAIATVADVMPLVNENRTIVNMGLNMIQNTQNLGLRRLLSSVKVADKITATTLGYSICPRINAAGRLNDAQLAFELLTTKDNEKADEYVKRINEYNARRQEMQELI